MKFNLDRAGGAHVVRAYAPGRIRIGDRDIATSVIVTAAIAVSRNCMASENDSNASRTDPRAERRDCGFVPELVLPVEWSIAARGIENLGERTRAGDIRRTGLRRK
jgi:hypothetical protein